MNVLYIDIIVTPLCETRKITIDKEGRIKLSVKSPPEKGKANKEIIKFFAEKTKISQSNITIVKGLTTRKKKIAFATSLSLPLLLHLLGIDYQHTL